MLLTAFLILVTASCLAYLLMTQNRAQSCVADIYQNGQLLMSIPLDEVQTPYTLDIVGEGGSLNCIEVRPGSIGMVSADCPDLLCVKQGFVHSPTIPITCLPNRLVIQLRPVEGRSTEAGPDAVTY